MNQYFDVAIAGGGPAGSMAARTLAGLGRNVVLLDASQFSVPRIGETMAPTVTNLLKKQGVWELFTGDGHLPSWGSRSAWGTEYPDTASSIFDPQGNGWHLDRNRFDQMLFEAARSSGAACFTGHKVVRVACHDACEMQVEDRDKRVHTIRSRFFIDATGRGSSLARTLGGKKKKNFPLLAHWVIYNGNDHTKSAMLVESAPDGWWYTAPVPGNQLVAVYFTDAEGARKLSRYGWDAALAEAPLTRSATEGLRRAGEPTIRSAGSHHVGKEDWGTPWLACGDALMAADPLSGSGIQHAMETGIEAALAADAWLHGDISPARHYQQKSQEAYQEYLGLRTAYYWMEKRWPESSFWKKQAAVAAPVKKVASGQSTPLDG